MLQLEALRFSSAIAVFLAVLFVAISSVMAITALFEGKTERPRLLPYLDNGASFFELFTAVPVIVTAPLCGEFILSASQGKDIIVWQQPDLMQFTKFGAGEGSVKSVVAIGNKVFTAHQDHRIRAWKVSRSSENVFKLVDTLPTAKEYLGNLMKQSNYVETRRHHKHLWIEHADTISCLAFYKLGIVYTASADGKTKAWRTQGKTSHSLLGVLEGHKDVSLNMVIISDDVNWVYGGGSDGYVTSWEGNDDSFTWKWIGETKAHQMAVLCMCMVGEVLFTGSTDKTIGIWKREAYGKLCKVGVINGHEGPVKCLQASPQCNVGAGFMLYSGGLDRSFRVWWVPKDEETS
ncbi:putative inactive purple acid phosphatase 1-like [Hibiscus syriacus]|uniref:Inactive purple acid phosphatase 1-like n=1 Tax=Hibiscus syriacus TaxID=106335 RepID=A0A6A3C2H2_HIBSY|nr:putative inactive purple acid phosphatase 1-like [Hibiscus syriacus]